MDMLRKLEPMALVLMVLGAINWGLVGLADTNVLVEVFGTGTVTDVIYALIGVAGLVYIPRLLDEFHVGAGAHPRGV